MKYSALATLAFLFFFLEFTALAQGIRGTIKSNTGEPLPFASIYIVNLQNGASSNIDGQYEMKLPAGTHTIAVQYIGYQAQQIQVEITSDWLTKDFVLTQQSVALKEVKVSGKDEDPAYTIMRKAIAKRKFHQLQYYSYEMKVYMKGTGELTNAPFFLKKKLKEEGVKLNEAYTSESVSLIKFRQPNKIEERVLSVRTSGSNKGSGSASPSLFIGQSFYKDKVAEAVSPLAGNAFGYYKFKYEGSFREGNLEVNKIRVTPRSRGDNVFEGYIYIIENLWAIHSLDLKTSLMGFPIQAKQNYAAVAPDVWMPVTHQYKFSGKVMGFGGEYKYLASCSDYKVELNKALMVKTEIIDEKVEDVPAEVLAAKPTKQKTPAAEVLANEDKMTRKQFRKMLNNYEEETLKAQKEPEVISEKSYTVDTLAYKRDSTYWSTARPVPLTEKEVKGYHRDDSTAVVEEAKLTGKDPKKAIKKKKFNPTNVITGGNYNLSPKTSININPTFTQVYYNTVEGFNLNASARLRHRYDSLRQSLEFTPTLRYGFSSHDFYAKGRFSHRMSNPKTFRNRFVFIDGGNFVEQFNPEEPIHPHINTLSALLFRKDYLKMYEKLYVKPGFAYQWSPFLKFSSTLEWARRSQLFNHADYSFFYNDSRTFSPSWPQNNELPDTGFPQHEALTWQANISYRPGGKYRVQNGRKIPLLENSPEFLLTYRKGIPDIFSSDVNYDQVQLGINHGLSFGVRGRLEYELRGGTFLNAKQMYFMDYQHFDGNRTILSSLRPAGGFRLLDYYAYSTNNSYFSGHTHFTFRKFLFTHIPEVRITGIKENIFFNYLKTSNSPHYYELGYSLDNVFRVLRLEAATSFENGKYKEFGFRIGIATILRFNSAD